MLLITPYSTMQNINQEYSFILNNPHTLTQVRGPILGLELILVTLSYSLGGINYQQFALSLVVLIPSFIFNHLFSQLQKDPKHNIIPLSLDLLSTFFLLFINGGRENPFYLVLLIHIFIAPFYLKPVVAFTFSALTVSSLVILPLSPFHFRALYFNILPGLNFPFIPLLIGGLIFTIFSTWLVAQIKTLNQFVQNSIKIKYRANRYRSLGLLTAGICHELGTPLHTLEMRLNQLKKKTSTYPDISSLWEKDFDVLQRSAQKCSNSIEKLNSQAHSESTLFQEEVCSATSTLEKTVALYAKDQERMINFECDELPQENTQIKMSEILYTRCLLELFENAYEAGANHIKIKMLQQHQGMILNIEDNGQGMGPEILKYLGQPFVSSKQRGSGLGLYHLINTLDFVGGKFKIMPKKVGDMGTSIQIQIPRHYNLGSHHA